MASVVGNISDTNKSKLVLSIKSCFKSYTSVIRWNASVIKVGSVCVSGLEMGRYTFWVYRYITSFVSRYSDILHDTV